MSVASKRDLMAASTGQAQPRPLSPPFLLPHHNDIDAFVHLLVLVTLTFTPETLNVAFADVIRARQDFKFRAISPRTGVEHHRRAYVPPRSDPPAHLDHRGASCLRVSVHHNQHHM